MYTPFKHFLFYLHDLTYPTSVILQPSYFLTFFGVFRSVNLTFCHFTRSLRLLTQNIHYRIEIVCTNETKNKCCSVPLPESRNHKRYQALKRTQIKTSVIPTNFGGY